MGLSQQLLVAASVLALTLQPALGMPEPTAAPELHSLDKRACSSDNCLRAVRRNVISAIPFCATYTTEPTATIPTWAANCQENPTRVYGPTDNTNYTIWEQAENIRSRPEEWEESLTQCMGLCDSYGSYCQSFSLVKMAGSQGPGSGLSLCYFPTRSRLRKITRETLCMSEYEVTAGKDGLASRTFVGRK
ncbi:hypothetical protein OPT61_g6635 [Boeremia exigua]|uniref:Uncharacterized protein n=1 Tax=Boeremia exigua TaxID=749465 RepID=A0ACC2I5C4_9PLEO|nr:hypothetical protein OPT61_g6635 [Boeremia exigua]